jgi:hypothetical protein
LRIGNRSHEENERNKQKTSNCLQKWVYLIHYLNSTYLILGGKNNKKLDFYSTKTKKIRGYRKVSIAM